MSTLVPQQLLRVWPSSLRLFLRRALCMLGQPRVYAMVCRYLVNDCFFYVCVCLPVGSATLILASEAAVSKFNLKPLARVVGWGVAGCDPKASDQQSHAHILVHPHIHAHSSSPCINLRRSWALAQCLPSATCSASGARSLMFVVLCDGHKSRFADTNSTTGRGFG